MLVKDVMCQGLVTVSPSETVRDCARKMDRLNIGALPVQEGGELVGFITDRDICCRVVSKDRDPNAITAKDIMTGPVHSCFDDDVCDRAVGLMRSEGLRRLVVVDRAYRIVGILSIDDLAHYSHELAGAVIDTSSNVCGNS